MHFLLLVLLGICLASGTGGGGGDSDPPAPTKAGWIDPTKVKKPEGTDVAIGEQQDKRLCRRNIERFSPKAHSGFTKVFYATRRCKESGFDAGKREGEFKANFKATRLIVSSKFLPYFSLAGMKGEMTATQKGNKQSDDVVTDRTKIGFEFGMMFVHLAEYKKKEGGDKAKGFIFGEDTIVRRYDTWNAATVIDSSGKQVKSLTNQKWSKVGIFPSDTDAITDQPKVVAFKLAKQEGFLGEVTFEMVVTPVTVVDNNVNSTVGGRKNIITPNTMKLNVRIKDITYSDSTSDGIAIAVVMTSKNRARTRAKLQKREYDDKDVELPGESTDDQEVLDIPDDADEKKKSGFTSFKKKVRRWTKNKMTEGNCIMNKPETIPANLKTLYQTAVEKVQPARKKLMAEGKIGIDLLWFSFPNEEDGKPIEEIIWDPTIGSVEDVASTVDGNGGLDGSSGYLATGSFLLMALLCLLL